MHVKLQWHACFCCMWCCEIKFLTRQCKQRACSHPACPQVGPGDRASGRLQGKRREGGIWFFPSSAVQFCKIISSFFSYFAQGHNEAHYYLLEVVSTTGVAKGSSKRCCICLRHTDFQAAKQQKQSTVDFEWYVTCCNLEPCTLFD